MSSNLPSHVVNMLSRMGSGIGTLDIQIADSKTVHLFDPNSLITETVRNGLQLAPPIPGVASELSGADAYYYRTKFVTLVLTRQEIIDLNRLRLTPDQFFKLFHRHGCFFEIHDDFYDFETGEAIQPK